MLEMDSSSKQPQISDMFQKFALAFKTKTIEFFADEDDADAAGEEDADGFALLDSVEEFITNHKVVVIKPDQTHKQTASNSSPIRPIDTQFADALLSSVFATVSSFEASYLQFQTAHAPFNEDGVKSADETLIFHLQRLYDLRNWYISHRRNININTINLESPVGSSSESQVQENQSKLRSLETMFNRLQSDIDDKDAKVSSLRRDLDQIKKSNSKLSMRLMNTCSRNYPNSEVVMTVRVFDSMLRQCCRTMHGFTKVLIDLMRKAEWDLEMAANSVHSGVDYSKKGHYRYAFLSYASMSMFRGFNLLDFGLDDSNEKKSDSEENGSLRELIEHVACNPMEILSKHPASDFARFCEKKYQQLIHPTMESSIFINLDRNEAVLSSWKSLSAFYEAFVKMASSIWLLHKLAYSFNPTVEIFQVERGVDFSMVYMEDTTKKGVTFGKSRPKVGFTVIPGFKIGKTIIQSQVYLLGSESS